MFRQRGATVSDAPAPKPDKTVALLRRLASAVDVPGECLLPSGEVVRFGVGAPTFRVDIKSSRALRRGLDEFALGQAYVNGDVDIDGDMLALLDIRTQLRHRLQLPLFFRFWTQLLLRSPARVNRPAVQDHYGLGDDFYLSFLDSKYRLYSHGLFQTDDDTLEQASEHKLATMFGALQLRPGMRLLDVGGGWGGVTQYCAPRGVHVTTVTLADDSYAYVRNLLRDLQLDGEVHHEDFLLHRPSKPYDAIVICGVIEHIPNYQRFCGQAWECLKPAGLMYLDASASKEKYDMSAFTRHYIWHGTHTFMALQDVVEELLYHGFELLEVRGESHDYELTIHHWARRFDAHRDMIVERWGPALYRAFRMYLWAGCHAFVRDQLQAYHVIARRSADAGPRPGMARRTMSFVRGLAQR